MRIKYYEKLFFLFCILFGLICFVTGCGINPTSTIEGLIPIVSAILGIAGSTAETILPAEASLISSGVNLVTNGLNALLNTLKSYDANKTAPGALNAVQAAFTAVQQNTTQLLTAAQVKNQTTAQKLTGVVNGIVSVLGTLEAYVVSKHPTNTPTSTTTS